MGVVTNTIFMVDFRLRVFISVAQHLSFTKASKELYISQPAVSKHIQELENGYGIQLFERVSSSIRLTTAGELFLRHARHIVQGYTSLKADMNLLNNNYSGELRIGASTTIAQYVLSEILAKFILRFSEVKVVLHTGNTQQIDQLLLEHKIDVGLVEGESRKRDFRYSLLGRDELVLVTSEHTKSAECVTIQELKQLPLVLRENGSGTLEVIERAMENHKIKLSELNLIIQLGSSESIKQFLMNSSAYAIISIAAVSRELIEKRLKIIDIEQMEMEREFSFISTTGSHNEIVEQFVHFATSYHNGKL